MKMDERLKTRTADVYGKLGAEIGDAVRDIGLVLETAKEADRMWVSGFDYQGEMIDATDKLVAQVNKLAERIHDLDVTLAVFKFYCDLNE